MEYKEKSRVEEDVKLINEFSYDRAAYTYGTETVHIYMFRDNEDQKLVWKTTGFLMIDGEDPVFPNKGSLIRIKGTVKGFDTYKGEHEVVLTRVKLLDIIEQAKTKEEILEEKRQAQLATLQDGDQVVQMLYSQYKEHYSDCETIADSFRNANDGYPFPMIDVIVRAGRMKNSGVRGKQYSYYRLKNEINQCIVYKAICLENALKRAAVEYPEHTWEYLEWV